MCNEPNSRSSSSPCARTRLQQARVVRGTNTTVCQIPPEQALQLTLPKLPAPSTQARPSWWWQISTSFGSMAMQPAEEGVSLLLRTDGCQPLLLPPSVPLPQLHR